MVTLELVDHSQKNVFTLISFDQNKIQITRKERIKTPIFMIGSTLTEHEKTFHCKAPNKTKSSKRQIQNGTIYTNRKE